MFFPPYLRLLSPLKVFHALFPFLLPRTSFALIAFPRLVFFLAFPPPLFPVPFERDTIDFPEPSGPTPSNPAFRLDLQ